jgi:hypothetical protein
MAGPGDGNVWCGNGRWFASYCQTPAIRGEKNFMRGFGRLLQMAGLVLLPLASLMQLSGTITVSQMLQMLALGICAFGIGWILSTYRLS